MSATPFNSQKCEDYTKMANATAEGSFVNIVDPKKSMRSEVSKNILADMRTKIQVYKQENHPIIHEKFDF